jgi:hypothetical protein
MTVEERIKNISEKWFIHEPVLFMTLMSHKITPNKGLRHKVRCGQGRIEYCFDNEEETMSDVELEDSLRAEVIRILLRHPYRHYNGRKHTAYLASNLTLNENYKFRFLKYKVADFWQDEGYKNQNFEFYYREILKLPPASGGSDLTKNQDNEKQNDDSSAE